MTTRSQPIRVPTGLDYGKAKPLADSQRAAPLPDNRSQPPAPGGGGAGVPTLPTVDVYGETDRPDEPVTAGAAVGPGPSSFETLLPEDPAEVLRAIYMEYPSPGLRRLLERAGQSRPL